MQVEEDNAEPKLPSVKKGILKPEEPVDELSKVKLGKASTKPVEEKLEEPQVAKTKKPVRKVKVRIFWYKIIFIAQGNE